MGYDNLAKLTQYCRKIQVVDDSDIFMGVTGRKGCGKSSFGIQFTRKYIEDHFQEKYFSIRKYMAFNNKDVFERLNDLQKYSPFIGDEAIRFAWSREWNKSDNKDLIKLSTQIRPKKHIFFMNIPRIIWVDKAYREGMLSMWAWVHATIEDGKKKAYAIIFEPDENQGEQDSWHLKKLRKATGKIIRVGKFTDIETIYKLVKNHPCFFDIVQFPPVPRDIYDEYMELRTKNVMENQIESVNQKETAKIICYNLKYNYDKFMAAINEGRFKKPTYRMIASTLCLDPTKKTQFVKYNTIRSWINEINDLVQKPAVIKEVENSNDTLEDEDEEQSREGNGQGFTQDPF